MYLNKISWLSINYIISTIKQTTTNYKMKKNLFTLTALILIAGVSFAQQRPYDQRGINVFETPKGTTKPFEKVKLNIGGSFTQGFQVLSQSNTASPNMSGTTNLNKPVEMVPGFNTAYANLYFDTYLADGVTLNMTLYLSSRHHNETWVKGGYIQFDKLPFLKSDAIDNIMKFTTIKVGHMEINYGDSHFRRSDNGNSIYNPFIENYIMDAFTTEIGAEFIFQHKGFLGVASVTNGKIKGDVIKATPVPGASDGKHHPAFIGKFGYDGQLMENLRLRATVSGYHTAGSVSNTLFNGDRAGSHYFGVMDNAITTSTFTSGRFNPGFSDKLSTVVGNLFVQFGGLEWFTTLESAKGRNRTEQSERSANQFATDLLYRFGSTKNFWIGGRYNTVSAQMAASDIDINRVAVSGGWFITKNILAKAEYVSQKYNGFVTTDIRNGGKFNGIVFEAVIGF